MGGDVSAAFARLQKALDNTTRTALGGQHASKLQARQFGR